MWWLAACTGGLAGFNEPLMLDGDGVRAVVRSEWTWKGNFTRVGLWADRFGTRGEVLADVEADKDGSMWLHFEVQTGLGPAVSALRLEADSGVLPMGTRPGEDIITMSKVPMDVDALAEAERQSQAGLLRAREAWEAGAFLLKEEGKVVGEVRFRGDAPPMVGVYDRWWLTPRPVEASLVARGAELVVGFDAEPSLQGEGGLLRINVPLQSAVAPIGEVPVDEERKFEVIAGRLSEDERSSLISEAIAASDAMEDAWVRGQGQKLARAALGEAGECGSWSEMKADWEMIFMGYDVDITAGEQGCVVTIETSKRQHGRRFKGEVPR